MRRRAPVTQTFSTSICGVVESHLILLLDLRCSVPLFRITSNRSLRWWWWLLFYSTVYVGSHSAWRTTIPLPGGVQNSHQNGGSDLLIFVADPRTTRLYRTRSSAYRREAATASRSPISGPGARRE